MKSIIVIKYAFLQLLYNFICTFIFIKNIFKILFIVLSTSCYAKNNFQFKLGASIAFGSHLQRIGIMAGTYININNFQVNAISTAYYNFKSYGPKGKFWEWQNSLGASFAFGKYWEHKYNIAFLQSYSNFINKKNAIAYAYNFYLDSRGTSQATATIAFTTNNYSISTQNDALAFTSWDRFRTGSFNFAYTDSNILLQAQLYIWTGQSNLAPTIQTTEGKKSMLTSILTNAKYGKHSNGILNFQAHFLLPFAQTVGAGLGFDHEKIRNFFQNKIIHTPIMLGNLNTKVKTTQIPMLANNGLPYLDSKIQQLKKGKMYYQLFLNNFGE